MSDDRRSAPGGTGSGGKLIIVSAPSGTGKTTICARLLREIPRLALSVSTTTRAPRGAEKDGEAYFFVPREEFRAKIAAGAFAEWAEVHGNYYGTTKEYLERADAEGKSLLLDIDVQGADSLHLLYPDRTVRIFLAPPSLAELERRLRARGTDAEETIRRRIAAAADEMRHTARFDHVVVNDDLERAYFQVAGIVLAAIGGARIAASGPAKE